MKKVSAILILTGISLASIAQSSVSGYVYEDKNSNGRKDKNEKGIAGVGVSNGQEVAISEKNGKYNLPVGSDNIIFVIKPSEYNLPVTSKNLPVFYYNHKPGGSPAGYKYKGVAPTGALPKSVDFALLPGATLKDFSSLIFGDPQPYTAEEVDYYAKGVVAEVEGIKNMQFGLSLGDLVGDSLDLHSPYISATQKVGLPWFNVMGNHDMNYDAKADSLSDETFELNFGPANYSFNYGDVHFIILDDILYPDPRDGKSYWGGFREDQFRFLENDLKLVPKDKLVVLSFHIPLSGNEESFHMGQRKRLFDLLKDFPNTLSLSAHTHLQRNDFFNEKDGWQRTKPHHEYNAATTSGDWYSGAFDDKGVPASTMRDGTPKGYAFIHFKGNQYTIDFKVVGKDPAYQISVYVPKNTNGMKPTTSTVYANFFMGYEGSPVSLRFDGGKWQKMKFSNSFDPDYVASMVKWDFADSLLGNRRPSLPVESTHLWELPVPRNLKHGEHKVEVRAKDLYGREFTTTQSFMVK
ncbi:MAG: calcineurin-like phosphoesterase family protein [Chitinophagaceae bacterium]